MSGISLQNKVSLKKNILMNSIRVLMQILFPLISFPYASRVLLPDGIGKVNLTTSIVAYFVLVASLGISTYGVRNGSAVRDERDKFSIFIQEVFIVNLITTLISTIVFVFVVFFVDALIPYRTLMLISGITIIATPFGLDWLYGAKEDYAYITKRAIIFQFISLALLFILVKGPEDINKYAFISVFSTVGSNIINIIHSRSYVNWKFYGFKSYNLIRHLKPVMIIFGLNIACNIYMNMDKTMLGFLRNDAEVGLYTAAYKVNTILLSFLNAIGAVLLPRMSHHLAKGEEEESKELLKKSFNYILLLSFPMVCGLIFLSKPIIILFSGGEYIDAVPTMQILSLIILISGMGTTLSTQYFVVRGKEKVCLFASSCAAVVNFVVNIILIPKLGHSGAAIATVICEIVALIVLIMVIKRETQIRDLFRDVFSYLISSVVMIPFLVIINALVSIEILNVMLSVVVGAVVYFAVLILFKNKYLIYFLDEIKGKMKR